VQHEFVRKILRRVTVGQTTVWTEIDKSRFLAALSGQHGEEAMARRISKHSVIKLSGELQILRRGSELLVIVPYHEPNSKGTPMPSLVNLIAQTRDWYERIISGEIQSIDRFAQQSGVTRRYIQRILRCATLSPKIVEALLAGKHRPDLTVGRVLRDSALDWGEQERNVLAC
jgi:hypothetical protein